MKGGHVAGCEENLYIHLKCIKRLPSFKLTPISLASLLWDIGKQNSPRWDAAEGGVPSGAILFA